VNDSAGTSEKALAEGVGLVDNFKRLNAGLAKKRSVKR
jgi:hypothetical protein